MSAAANHIQNIAKKSQAVQEVELLRPTLTSSFNVVEHRTDTLGHIVTTHTRSTVDIYTNGGFTTTNTTTNIKLIDRFGRSNVKTIQESVKRLSDGGGDPVVLHYSDSGWSA